MFQRRSCLLSNYGVDKNSVHLMRMTKNANESVYILFTCFPFQVVLLALLLTLIFRKSHAEDELVNTGSEDEVLVKQKNRSQRYAWEYPGNIYEFQNWEASYYML